MKTDVINGLKIPVFRSQIKEQKDNSQIQNSQGKNVNKKKILYAALGTLALAGATAILINNARKGKIKEPKNPIDIPKPPVKEPEITPKPSQPEELKPSVEQETKKFVDMEEPEQKSPIQADTELSQELKPLKITVIKEKPEFSPEALDKRAVNGAKKPDAWSFEDMKDYYQNGCPTLEKFEGGVEYTYPKAQDGSLQTKIIFDNGDIKTNLTTTKGYNEILKDADGNIKTHRMSNFKSKSAVEKRFENGKVVEIFSYDKTGRTRTIIDGDIKSSVHINKDGSEVHKIYQKDANGNYRCIKRETVIKNKDGIDYSIKAVEYTEDGQYSKTTETEKLSKSIRQTTKIIIRAGKGYIVDESTITKNIGGSDDPKSSGKVLATWYLNYLKLCKEFGIYPHSGEAGSGAWLQFRELLMRKNDPEAYARYLRLEEYRSKYDTNAAIGMLRRDIEKSGLNVDNLNLKNLEELSAEEINFLTRHIKSGHINITVEELQKMSANDIKTMLYDVTTMIKEEAKEAQRLRELEKQRQAQQQQIMIYS